MNADAMEPDYRSYYDLENHLFNVVGPRWREQGWLSAFDLFTIFTWKANRARKYMVNRMYSQKHASLDEAAHELTAALAAQPDLRLAFQYLIDHWEFRLPTASALLTVLHPETVTIYDTRVCASLESINRSYQFGHLADVFNFDKLWTGYQAYRDAVVATAPANLSLRDKDRWHWGHSSFKDLEKVAASPPLVTI